MNVEKAAYTSNHDEADEADEADLNEGKTLRV